MILEFFEIVILLLVSASIIYSFKYFAPWVPTFDKDLDRIFALAKMQPGQIFLDLGCGNGKMVFEAARRGYTGQGIELAIPLYLWAKVLSFFKPNSKIFFGNLFHAKIDKADTIFIYGLPQNLNDKIISKLRTEKGSNTKIITYCFPLNNITPTSISHPDGANVPIYLYEQL